MVDLLNADCRTGAKEFALDRAVVRGHTVLYGLMRGAATLPGESDYLAAFRTRPAQPPRADEAVARCLCKRLLIAELTASGACACRLWNAGCASADDFQ